MQYTNFPTQFAGFNPFAFNNTYTNFSTPWNTQAWTNGAANCCTPGYQNGFAPALNSTPWNTTPWFATPGFQTPAPSNFGPAYTPSYWAAPQFATPGFAPQFATPGFAPQFAAQGFAPEFAYSNPWCAPSFNGLSPFAPQTGLQGYAPVGLNAWSQTPNFYAQGQFGATPGFAPVANPWNYSNGYSNGVYGAPVTQGVSNGYASKTGVCRDAA